MSEPKFTAGPWNVWLHAGNRERGVYGGELDAAGIGMYRVASIPNVNGSEENRANAALIAAAPDLYAALVDLMGWIPGPKSWHTDEPQNSIDRARAALAKARGEVAP